MKLNNDKTLFAGEAIYSLILDSIDEQVTVIDELGHIQYVNQTWLDFYVNNGGNNILDWKSQNYLSVCDIAAKNGDDISSDILKGLQNLILRKQSLFTYEYPCHSPSKELWYLFKAFPLKNIDGFFVIVHIDVTNNKIMEQNAFQSSLVDPLTGLYNRRGLEFKSNEEFSRAMRAKCEVSVCIFDIDCFKLYNDSYGHQAGDKCLSLIANEIKNRAKRPGDIAARLGGDEFMLMLFNTSGSKAVTIATKLKEAVLNLDLSLPSGSQVTISGGITCVSAFSFNSNTEDLYKYADIALYKAKKSRNSICCSYPENR